MAEEDDILSATGLALAAIAALIERPEPIPKGEVARILTLLASTASPERPRQQQILLGWAELLANVRPANER